MRKIILAVAVSLDGFIEGPNGEYDWCPPPSQNEMNKFLDGIDIIFFGRKSYEIFGSGAYPGKTSYVFSNTLKSVQGNDTHLLSGDIVAAVQKIRKQEGKNIWLWGGANLTTTFMNEALVDELWLAVVPVVLGAGKPLFQDIRQRTHFTLMKAIQQEGYLSLKYKCITP